MSDQPSPAPAKSVKAPQKSARRRSREIVLQGLYEWLLNGTDGGVIEAHLHEAEGFSKADRTHLSALLHGVIREEAELTARFTQFLDRPVAELSPIERAAILIGAFELRNCLDIPYRVVINEAVELTKTFGGTDGFKYVNGVLDKLAAELRSAEVESKRRR